MPGGDVSPGVAQQHLLVRHEAAQPHRVRRDTVHDAPAGTSGRWVVASSTGPRPASSRAATVRSHRIGGGARRGIDLVGVVQFDDLDRLVEPGGPGGEGHHQHRAEGEPAR